MSLPLPKVVTIPRLEPCRGTTVWDRESAVLRTSFEVVPSGGRATPDTLREHIDEALRIRRTPLRLVIGSVEIAYRNEWHIDSIEFRTSPSTWRKESIDDVGSQAVPVWMQFDVTPDDNGIFTLDTPTAVCWDAVANRLAVRFGAGVSVTWSGIADSVAAGTSADGSLAELRFLGCRVPLSSLIPRGTGG